MEHSAQKTFIIPVFIPHKGCPHRCVFCNQTTITGKHEEQITPESLRRTIEDFLGYRPENSKTQISFYGGTFLGLPEKTIELCLSVASEYVKKSNADSIRFSTRPDSVTSNILSRLQKYPIETIELGVQSMNNTILSKAGRGHTEEDTVEAVNTLKTYGYETGLQLMPGLPGDTDSTILDTTDKTIQLKPDFVRIYPTIVFKGSGLERMTAEGSFAPLSLDKSVTVTKKMYLRFLKAGIPVVRMGLQASADFEENGDIIQGPYHPAFGHLVFSALFLEMATMILSKSPVEKTELHIYVNSSDISKMRGLKNYNIDVLLKTFKPDTIKVKTDNSLNKNMIKINDTTIDVMSLCNDL